MAGHTEMPDFLAALPERVWYLTSTGRDMWCRRPYGFLFSSSDKAAAFAAAMASPALELSPIGMPSKEVVSEEGVQALRRMEVTRLFLDPEIDPASGDVFGTILRISPLQ